MAKRASVNSVSRPRYRGNEAFLRSSGLASCGGHTAGPGFGGSGIQRDVLKMVFFLRSCSILQCRSEFFLTASFLLEIAC